MTETEVKRGLLIVFVLCYFVRHTLYNNYISYYFPTMFTIFYWFLDLLRASNVGQAWSRGRVLPECRTGVCREGS